MKIIFSIIYAISIICGIVLFIVYSLPLISTNSASPPILSIIVVLFLLMFGIYGLIGEKLLKKLAIQNPDSLEIEASYYIRKKGFIGKFFLFPFIHIKSRHSIIIAFFGSLVWMIILMIVYFGIIAKILNN